MRWQRSPAVLVSPEVKPPWTKHGARRVQGSLRGLPRPQVAFKPRAFLGGPSRERRIENGRARAIIDLVGECLRLDELDPAGSGLASGKRAHGFQHRPAATRARVVTFKKVARGNDRPQTFVSGDILAA